MYINVCVCLHIYVQYGCTHLEIPAVKTGHVFEAYPTFMLLWLLLLWLWCASDDDAAAIVVAVVIMRVSTGLWLISLSLLPCLLKLAPATLRDAARGFYLSYGI